MKLQIEILLWQCAVLSLTPLQSLCFFRENRTENLYPRVEQGTKVYEFQLDTGGMRDERPDKELTHLELLDRKISRILMDPQKGEGPMLISSVKEFAEKTLLLKTMLVNQTIKVDPNLKQSAVKVYQRYGHPRFMTVIVTNGGEHLQTSLDLSDDLMWQFYGYRQKANEYWDDIRAVFVRNPRIRSDQIEADRFKHLPWPLHLDNLTSFEEKVLERSDLDSVFDLGDALNISSHMF